MKDVFMYEFDFIFLCVGHSYFQSQLYQQRQSRRTTSLLILAI